MHKARRHPAGKLAFTLKGDATVALINDKLASHLSAKDRLRDAADVQSLIKRLKLPLEFANRLALEVRRLAHAAGIRRGAKRTRTDDALGVGRANAGMWPGQRPHGLDELNMESSRGGGIRHCGPPPSRTRPGVRCESSESCLGRRRRSAPSRGLIVALVGSHPWNGGTGPHRIRG